MPLSSCKHHIRIDRSGWYQIVIAMHWLRTEDSQPLFFGTPWAFVLKSWFILRINTVFPDKILTGCCNVTQARAAQTCCWSVNSVDRRSGRCCCFSKLYVQHACRWPGLPIEIKFSTEEKEINNGTSTFFDTFGSTCRVTLCLRRTVSQSTSDDVL